ncbi:MAG: N-acetyltransferase family protein [Vicinamibacterales bacterium]
MACSIRLARRDDLPAINDIYNHYVRVSTCTYQEIPEPLPGRQAWFDRHGPGHPVTVAEQDGCVIGWGSLSPYHARSAYRYTVENSVYVDHRCHRQGIGSALLRDLIERGHGAGLRTIIACIDAGQTASVTIHAKHGFVMAGQLVGVGYKFDRWLDVVYMQLVLNEDSTPADPR